jgi:hypothetical protein
MRDRGRGGGHKRKTMIGNIKKGTPPPTTTTTTATKNAINKTQSQ